MFFSQWERGGAAEIDKKIVLICMGEIWWFGMAPNIHVMKLTLNLYTNQRYGFNQRFVYVSAILLYFSDSLHNNITIKLKSSAYLYLQSVQASQSAVGKVCESLLICSVLLVFGSGLLRGFVGVRVSDGLYVHYISTCRKCILSRCPLFSSLLFLLKM